MSHARPPWPRHRHPWCCPHFPAAVVSAELILHSVATEPHHSEHVIAKTAMSSWSTLRRRRPWTGVELDLRCVRDVRAAAPLRSHRCPPPRARAATGASPWRRHPRHAGAARMSSSTPTTSASSWRVGARHNVEHPRTATTSPPDAVSVLCHGGLIAKPRHSEAASPPRVVTVLILSFSQGSSTFPPWRSHPTSATSP